jgi:leader peptidase (prepilin peptidase)/N-methyltransferase
MLPTWFFLTALALFGLAFGSFANVVIWRFPRGESLSSPPSRCPA